MINEDTNINLDKAQARKDVKELKKFWLADFNKMHESRYRDPNAVMQEFMVNNLHKDKTQFTALEDVGLPADEDYRNRLITTLKGGVMSGADLFMGLGRAAETAARGYFDLLNVLSPKTENMTQALAPAVIKSVVKGKPETKDFVNSLFDYTNAQYEALRQRSEAEVKWTKSMHQNFAKAIGIAADEKDDPLFTTIGSAAGSVVQSMVGGVVLKAPKLVAALWGVAQAQDSWEEARQNGIGRTQAAAAAVSNGTLNALIENMALERILKAFKLNKPLGKILESFLTEGSEEFLQGVVDESLMQSLGGRVKEFKDTLQDLYVSFIIGGISGGAVAGSHSAFEKLVNITGKEKAESIAKAVAAAAASPQAQAETDKIIHRQEHPANFPNDSAKAAIDQTKAAILEQDRVKQLNNISTEFETFFKNNGIDEDTAAAGGRIAANVVNLISLQNGITPELARDYLNLDILREQIKNGQISGEKQFNQAAAMYKNKRNDIGTYYDFIFSTTENKKSYFEAKTDDGYILEIPGDTLLHTNNRHPHILKEDWKNLLTHFNKSKYYVPKRPEPVFSGTPYYGTFSIGNTHYGFIFEILPNGHRRVSSLFKNTENGINAFVKEKAANALEPLLQHSQLAFNKGGADFVGLPKDSVAKQAEKFNTFESFNQAAAMYKNKRNLRDFVDFVRNEKPTKKSFIEHTTPQGNYINLPSDTVIHTGNGHILSKEDYQMLFDNFDDILFYQPKRQNPKYDGYVLLGKFEKTGIHYGVVSELFNDGEFKITTFFKDNAAAIDNWIKQKAPDAPQNPPLKPLPLKQAFLSRLGDNLASRPKDSVAKQAEKFNTFESENTHLEQSNADNQEEIKNNNQQAVDLTAEFANIKGLTAQNAQQLIEQELNKLIDKPLDTATPPLQIQITSGNKAHIKRPNVPLKSGQLVRHQAVLSALEKVVNKAEKIEKDGTVDLTHNTRKRTLQHKESVDKYVYFKAPVQAEITDENRQKSTVYFEVELATEQIKGQDPNLLDLYNVRVKKMFPAHASQNVSAGNTNSITNNAQNGNTLNQGHRGSIDLYKKGGVYHALVKLMQTSDKTTLLHEMAHLWLYTAQDVYSAKEFADIKNDLDNWIGKPLVVNGRFIYSEKQQEKFAKGLEEYLRQGQAPTPALKRIFEKLCLFFRNVYNGALVDMSLAGRAVYDRMFTLGKQQAQQAMTFHQDPVKNKKTVKAIKQLRQTGTTDVEGISLKDIENYLSILDAGAPPKPKDTLLKYLKKYGADYANCGKIDKEAYQNAKIPNKKSGIQDDLFRQLKDWGFMDGDAYSYGELSELNEQAADLIDRALSGEDIFRLEDTADAENYQQYLEAVDMAEDALGGKIDEYRRVKKIIQGLRVEGYRPVNKRDIAFLLKQIEQVQTAAQKAMQPKIDAAKAQAKLNKEIAERRLSDLQSAKVQARQEQEEKTLKENVFKAEDITELHHQLTGETIPINDHIKGNENKEIETVKVEKLHFKDKENTKNISNEEIANILFVKNENRSKKNAPVYMPLELKNKDGKTYLLSRSSADKIINTIYKTGNLKESKDKKELLCNIKDIFAKADKIISHKDIKGIKRNIDRFATVAKIGDRTYMILFTVKNGKLEGSEILSLYNMEADKKEAPSTSRTYPGHREHIYTLGDLRDFVKRKIAKYNKFYAKNRAAILQELKKENEEQGTNTVQPADKTAEEQKAEVKQQDIDKKAQGLKKAVLAEISKREIENKQELLKELESAKDTADILSAADNLLDKLQREYEKTPQGQQEKRRTDVPSTDWDSKKISLLKELSELLSKQDEKTKQAFEILRQAHLVKTGYRAALDKDEQAALSKAKEFLNENFTPRVVRILNNAFNNEEHLYPKDVNAMVNRYSGTITNFNKLTKFAVNDIINWAKLTQKQNYNRYMWKKINTLLNRKLIEKSGNFKKSKYDEATFNFLQKAREIWSLTPEMAQQQLEERMAATQAAFNEGETERQEDIVLNEMLDFLVNGKDNVMQDSKELYDNLSAFISNGKNNKWKENFRKQVNRDSLREAAVRALRTRNFPLGAKWFLSLPDTNFTQFLLNAFGTIEHKSLDEQGNITDVKTNIAEMFDTLKGQMASQHYKYEKAGQITEIIKKTLGLKDESAVLKKIEELNKTVFTAENYMRIANENDGKSPVRLISTDNKAMLDEKVDTDSLSKAEILTLYLWFKNSLPQLRNDGSVVDYGYRGRLLRQYGEKQLNAMFALLTNDEIKMAESLQRFVASQGAQNNAVFKILHGFSMKMDDPDYFPGKALRADIGGEVDYMKSYIQTRIDPNFTRERVKSYRVEMKPVSIFEIVQNHTNRSAEYINEAINFAQVKTVLKTSALLKAFQYKFGKTDGEKIYNKMLRLIDLQGPKLRNGAAVKSSMDFIFNAWVKSAMALKATIALKQFATGLSFAENMPALTWLKYFAQGIANPKKTWNFMIKAVPRIEVRAAQGSINEYLQRAMNSNDFDLYKTKWDVFTNAMLFNIRYGDKMSFVFGGYPYYRYLTEQKGLPPQTAANMVARQGEMTLQSSQKALLGEEQLNENSYKARIFTVFRNQSKQYFGKLATSYIQFKNGEISAADFGKTWLLYAALNPMIYTLLGFAWLHGGDDKDEDKQNKAVYDVALSPLTGLASVNAFAEAAVRYLADIVYSKANNKKLPQPQNLSMPAFEDIQRDIKQAVNAYNKAGSLENLFKAMTMQEFAEGFAALAKYSGLPAQTVLNMAGGVNDIAQGSTGRGALRLAGFTEYRAGIMTGEHTEDNKKWKKVKL